MPRIQERKLNKGHQRKLKALRKSLGKKKASKIDPVAARLADCIGKEDKKKLKLKIPRGGYLVRRGFQGVILVEAAPAKRKKKASAKPKRKKAVAKPKKRKPAAKKATRKKTARKKR